MNKAELAAAVAQKTGLSKKEAAAATSAVFEAVTDALKEGEKVQIIGFGGFEAKDRPERKGHNPSTGAEITIPASKAPVFKAGKAFKDALK